MNRFYVLSLRVALTLLVAVSVFSNNASAQSIRLPLDAYSIDLPEGRVTFPVDRSKIAIKFKDGISNDAIQKALREENVFSDFRPEWNRPFPEITVAEVNPAMNVAFERVMEKLQARADVEYATPVLVYEGKEQLIYDVFFVKLKQPSDIASLQKHASTFGFTVDEKEYLPNIYFCRVNKNSQGNAFEIARQLQRLGGYEFAEPDFVYTCSPNTNDPSFTSQWCLKNTGQLNGVAGADVDAELAWNITTGSSAIKIAILDCFGTVEQFTHPDLVFHSWYDATGTGFNASGYNDAHGIACAGIVKATGNNSLGGVGIAYNANVIAVKLGTIINSSGNWSATGNSISNGIIWAYQNADIQSNSNTFGSSSSLVNTAISNSVTLGRGGKGTPFFSSSGNGDTAKISYPASYAQAISVGASSMCDQRKSKTSCDNETWWGGNYGTGADITAPGVKMRTTDLAGSPGYSSGDYATSFNGTSSSCPLAAGVMALVLSANPNLTYTQARAILESTCEKVGGYTYSSNVSGQPNGTWSYEMGYGRINAYYAVSLAAPCTSPVTPTVSVTTNPSLPVCAGTTVTFTATPTYGGPQPSYQWKVNGTNVGTNSETFTCNYLADGDVVTVVLTSNHSCVTGNTAVSPAVTMSVNNVPSTSHNLTTNYNSGTSQAGNMFDVQPSKDIVVTGFNAHFSSTAAISIYYKTGTHVGFETNASAWTLLGSASSIPSNGNWTASPVPINLNLALSAGQVYAFYVTRTDGSNLLYNNGTAVGATAASDANVVIKQGNGISYPFGTVFAPRIWNGTLRYNVVTPPSVSVSSDATNPFCYGTNVTFTATPTVGGTTPSYQWKLNGTNVGTNAATYGNASLNHNDKISVVMTSNATCVSPQTAVSNVSTTQVNYTPGTQTFSNTTPITLPTSGVASVYPSSIEVSGMGTSLSNITVSINGLSHTYPDDIDIMLESPTGQRLTLMSDCGSTYDLVSTGLTFSDAAASRLPDASTIASGTYKPTNFVSPDTYASPGAGSFASPTGTSSATFALFNGINPNGTWKLYIVDDLSSNGGSIDSWSITVTTSPSITGTASVCSGQNGVAYSISPVTNSTGYNWTLPNGAIISAGTSTNSINADFGLNAVSGNVTVAPYNACGNANYITYAVTVNQSPAPVISGDTQIPLGGNTTLDAGAGFTTYHWSTGSTTQSIETDSAGEYIVTVTSNSGCSGIASATVHVAASSLDAVVSSTNPLCFNSGDGTATAEVTGGTAPYAYLWSNGQTNATATGLSSGSFTVTVTDVNNNTASASTTLTSPAPPTALAQPGAISVSGGSAKVCPGDVRTYSVAAVSGATSYLWTPPVGGTVTSGQGLNSVSIAFDSAFVATGTLSVVAVKPCTTSVARTLSISRNVPATPSVISGQYLAVCAGTTKPYSVTSVAGMTYQWTAPANAVIVSGQGTNAVTVEFGGSFVSGTLGVKASNTCGLSANRTMSIVSVPGMPGTISVNISGAVCAGAVRTYTIAAVANATSYVWSVPAGAEIISGQGTTSVSVEYTTAFTANGSVKVCAQNACGVGAARTLGVTANTPSQPGTISVNNATNVCPGDVRIYTITSVANATSYLWTPPTGGTITDGQGTTSVTIQYNESFTGTSAVTVKSQNACGESAARSLSVYLNSPAQPSAIAGASTAVCAGTSGTYSVANLAGVTYEWMAPANAIVSLGQGSNSVTVDFGAAFTSGTLSVKATNGCGISTARTLSISSLPGTPGNISGFVYGNCNSTQVHSVATVANATSYVWSTTVANAVIQGNGGNTVTVTWPQYSTGTLSVSAANACGTGPARSVSVVGNPRQPGLISGPTQACANSTQNYSVASVQGATSYTWTVPAGASITSGLGSNAVTVQFGSAGGTVSVKATNACGSGSARTLSVAVSNCGSRIAEEDDVAMQLYPNPASDKINVMLPRYDSDAKLKIVNGLGQVLTVAALNEVNQTGSEVSFDISDFAAGVYQVVFENKAERQTLRFVKP